MSNHKHHIVPIYKCKELGLTTSYKIDGREFYFKENMVEVTREQHALIHWGYWCNDLSPLLEICNPSQWVIDMIPLEDVRDSGAASVISLGEIEQIDISGENHPNWKGGISVNDPVAYNRVYGRKRNQTPERKEWMKEYTKKLRQTPKYKAWKKKWSKEYYLKNKLEINAKKKQYRQTPERKEYMKEYRQKPEVKEYHKAYQKEYRLQKKLERQGQGTLDQFIG